MASELKTVTVVPLNGSNYPTWKVQCRMALMRDGLWNIVNGTEHVPTGDGERRAKFLARKNRALAIIVLSVDPSLLYLIRGSHCSLEKARRSISKENLGKQVRATTETSFPAAARGRLCPRPHQSHDRDLRCTFSSW